MRVPENSHSDAANEIKRVDLTSHDNLIRDTASSSNAQDSASISQIAVAAAKLGESSSERIDALRKQFEGRTYQPDDQKLTAALIDFHLNDPTK